MAKELEANVYTQGGKTAGTVHLPEALFAAAWNGDLVHQVVTSLRANARARIAHTKDRSEVRGGGRKPWRQKGTGNARHGSIRSPLWEGGGITFGPRSERSFTKKINRKMRGKALAAVLSQKHRDGEVLFVEGLSFAEPKAAEARSALRALAEASGTKLAARRRNAALVALPEVDVAAAKSFRNFGNVAVKEIRNITPLDVLSYKYLVIVAPERSLEELKKRRGTTAPAAA